MQPIESNSFIKRREGAQSITAYLNIKEKITQVLIVANRFVAIMKQRHDTRRRRQSLGLVLVTMSNYNLKHGSIQALEEALRGRPGVVFESSSSTSQLIEERIPIRHPHLFRQRAAVKNSSAGSDEAAWASNETLASNEAYIINRTFNDEWQNFEMIHSGPFMGPYIPVSFDKFQDVDRTQQKIVGGDEALPHSFYTMLMARDRYGWLWAGCGGTLISNCHILTAAHCATFDLPITGVFVNAFKPTQGPNNNGGMPFHFSYTEPAILHPDYDADSNIADLAVIRMQTCLDPDKFRPAKLAVHQDKYHRSRRGSEQLMLQVMGFGSTYEGMVNMADTLREVNLPFMPRPDCQHYYGFNVNVDMVCAGYARGGIADACQGDSGGGLIEYEDDGKVDKLDKGKQTNRNGSPHVVGIVSWYVGLTSTCCNCDLNHRNESYDFSLTSYRGVGCARANNPGVYTYVPFYRKCSICLFFFYFHSKI